jgi:hypothetical protein
MTANPPMQPDRLEALALFRGVLREFSDVVLKLAECAERIARTLAHHSPACTCPTSIEATKPPARSTVRGANFTKVRNFLVSLLGTPATIPVISRGTGVPQASIRNLLYVTKKAFFKPVPLPGSSEKGWQLADPEPSGDVEGSLEHSGGRPF